MSKKAADKKAVGKKTVVIDTTYTKDEVDLIAEVSPKARGAYLSRCLNQLKARGAPLEGWYCVEITDVRDDDKEAPLAICELCGCASVRYVHAMEHDDYDGRFLVGCVCAGTMEGDEIAARDREKVIKRWSARRRHFVESFAKKPWEELPGQRYKRTYKEYEITVRPAPVMAAGRYYVEVNGKTTFTYKKEPIDNLTSAIYAAYGLIDPLRELLKEHLHSRDDTGGQPPSRSRNGGNDDGEARSEEATETTI